MSGYLVSEGDRQQPAVRATKYSTRNISSTSAVSSTNFRSILIFASCFVGTCNILVYIGEFLLGGVLFLSSIMVSVGIYTLDGEF